MINLKKIKVELRVCIAKRHIFGCYLFGQTMTCQECPIDQCEIRGVRIVDDEFVKLLESRKISMSGGICSPCYEEKQNSRGFTKSPKGVYKEKPDVHSSHTKSLAEGG